MAKLQTIVLITLLLLAATTTTAQPDMSVVSKQCGPPAASQDRDAVLIQLGNPLGNVGSGSVQGVTQCTSGLSVDQCTVCVNQAVNILRTNCGSSSFGDVILGNCYARFVDTVTISGSGSDLDSDSGSGFMGSTMRIGSLKLNSYEMIAALLIVAVILIFLFIFMLKAIERRKHRGASNDACVESGNSAPPKE